jgi:hypothetical protein
MPLVMKDAMADQTKYTDTQVQKVEVVNEKQQTMLDELSKGTATIQGYIVGQRQQIQQQMPMQQAAPMPYPNAAPMPYAPPPYSVYPTQPPPAEYPATWNGYRWQPVYQQEQR